MTFPFKRSEAVSLQKATIPLRAFFIFFLIFTISPWACAPLPAPTTSPATRPAQATATEELSNAAVNLPATSLKFVAEADAQVNEDDVTRNAGSSTFLQVDDAGDPAVESFILFTVRGITGPIHDARLRVYATTNPSDNGPAVYASDSSWTEGEINWNNRPERTSDELDNKDSIQANAWVEYDVTAAVTGDGTVSFVLVADSSDAATFSSRQGDQPPELVITLADGPTATAGSATALPPTAAATDSAETPGSSVIFITEADARVNQSEPDNNYGSGTTLQADEGELESFIRFTVSGISGTIQSAMLRVYVTDNGTTNGPAVYASDPSWEENEITWNNKPERTSEAVDNQDSLNENSWADYDVTSLVSGNGTYSFVLVADSSDGVVFSSLQGVQPPQLVLTRGGSLTTATPTMTPGGSLEDTVLVGAGDIAHCRDNNAELTAQLLDAIPGTVFTTGDNAYNRGAYNEFMDCYDPTWGRHKDRTRPVPGNHEYRTEGAAGYFQYFDNIPSYYAYDLGSWRIYALNSEIDVSEDSAQAVWLRTDLAANPRQCVLAYWHQPRWSSGSRHGSDPDFQVFWEIFYEAGAELVINGHEHSYERFAEMDETGAAVSPGLREIVVGTGGRNLYDFDTALPSSEVRDASTYGVLKLTLRPDAYDWEFIPLPGSIFTDRGSTNCH